MKRKLRGKLGKDEDLKKVTVKSVAFKIIVNDRELQKK